jgi:hypothetical protein
VPSPRALQQRRLAIHIDIGAIFWLSGKAARRLDNSAFRKHAVVPVAATNLIKAKAP